MPHSSKHHKDHETGLNNFFTLDQLLRGNDQQFVEHAYLALLGRGADTGGLDTYTSLLLDGKSRVELLIELGRSAEGKAHAAYVVGLEAATSLAELLAHQDAAFLSATFQTFLARPIDTNALMGYGGQLRKGVARLDLLTEIRQSGESKSKDNLVHEIENIAQVGEGVQLVELDAGSDVNPDIAGDNAAEPPTSATQLMGLGSTQFIHGVHQILLARVARKGELHDYRTRMQSGVSRIDIIRAVIQSEERQTRRSMLVQLDATIKDLQLQQQPLLGRAARERGERLDRLVEKQKLQMMQTQLAAMNQQMQREIANLNKKIANSTVIHPEKKRALHPDQLSPLARDIYFQLRAGFETHEEDGL